MWTMGSLSPITMSTPSHEDEDFTTPPSMQMNTVTILDMPTMSPTMLLVELDR